MIKTGYYDLTPEMLAAIERGDTFNIGIELFPPTTDEIFDNPQRAAFKFSDTLFYWRNLTYKAVVNEIPDMKKYIGKQFNNFSFKVANVQRGIDSGSSLIFKQLIRGFRIGVRIIFPDTPELIEHTRYLWWGRVKNARNINEDDITVNCSQEIGDFSYKLADQNFGTACPLFFGRGECLGDEKFEQKSLLYQQAFNEFGQGGCNRTEERCIQFDRPNEPNSQRRFYQGQKQIAITGNFVREDIVKKKFLFWTIKKKVRVDVPYSSKNQAENDDETIPIGFGRTKVDLRAFTWADTGDKIVALLGAMKGQVQSFHNVTCTNDHLTIESVTEHLGELGGVGTQQPDPRFPQSGHNSKLAYLGITYAGSPPDDEPEEAPATSAVVKAMLVKVRNSLGLFELKWANNPVWIIRHILTSFRYTVVKEEWFDDEINQDTADYCFEVIEDDTNAEIAKVTANEYQQYIAGAWRRFRSTGRYDIGTYQAQVALASSFAGGSSELEEPAPVDIPPDIEWFPALTTAQTTQRRTYLALRYTLNYLLTAESDLSDVLFSALLPAFRGYLDFTARGEIGIRSRRPADNSYIRHDSAIGVNEVPIVNVSKFIDKTGYLLVGVGQPTCEYGKIRGIRYVNGSALTEVTASAGGLGVTYDTRFQDRQASPSQIQLIFSGTPTVGDRLYLKFAEPDGTVYEWDYYVDDAVDNLSSVVKMFQTRLMASPAFKETWTAEFYPEVPNQLIIRCQTGYVKLEEPLLNTHAIGEEVLRVVEVYEDGKDETNPNGKKDNIVSFNLNDTEGEDYQGVTAEYISAVEDFGIKKIQPRIVWDAAEQERNLRLLKLNLRAVDNYRQAAYLVKAQTIDAIDGNLPARLVTGLRGAFHEFGEVIAVRHQTMEGMSYTPFWIEDIGYTHTNMRTSLGLKLYLSASFDERVAQREKFLDTTLTKNENYQATPPPIVTDGGFSTTRTGDGAGDRANDIRYEPQKYKTFPALQKYSPHGRDML